MVDQLVIDVGHAHDKITVAAEVEDVTAVGDIIWKDPKRKTRNYYGWSHGYLANKKALAEKFAAEATGYADLGPLPSPEEMAAEAAQARGVDDPVARARALAGDRGGRGGRGGARGGRGRGRAQPAVFRAGRRR